MNETYKKKFNRYTSGSRPRNDQNNKNQNKDLNNNTIKTYNSRNRSQNWSLYASSSRSTEVETKLSLKKVNELIDKQPNAILLELESSRFSLKNYLEAPTMGDELIKKLAILFEKALACNSMKTKLIGITQRFLVSSYFNNHLYNQLQRDSHSLNQITLIRTIMNISCLILELNSNFLDDLAPMKDRLELVIMKMDNNQGLKRDFDDRLKKLEENIIKRREKDRHKTIKNEDLSDLEPPNDFTEMSIEPKLADILCEQTPFLRKNITNGAYKNVHHYLDVQFRLLREDYLQPLREGILEFRGIIKKNNVNLAKLETSKVELNSKVKKELRNIDSLNIYYNVTVHNTKLSNVGMVYQMKMNDDKKIIDWEFSKRLMFGSMVCLSSDFYMSNCLIGIICERDMNELKRGVISIRFNYDSMFKREDESSFPSQNKTYIMLETTAFFESYKHVLESLVSFQHLGDSAFPFKKHLVDCDNQTIDRPEYLKNACLDMRTLVDHKKKIKVSLRGESKYEFTRDSEFAKKCFLSNKDAWPTAQDMNLDSSQYEAIKLALENKLALIQGPPGTGKTFIGVKLVQLLLHNEQVWWNRPEERHRPILMICYTNHALDQFLEFCISECKLNSGIVRVGGRSKSENLNSYLLSNLKSQMRINKRISDPIYYGVRNQRNILERIKEDIDLKEKLKNESFNSIITIEELKKYMRIEHLNQLEGLNEPLNGLNERSNSNFTLLEWLGFFDISNIVENEPEESYEDELNEINSNLQDLNLNDQFIHIDMAEKDEDEYQDAIDATQFDENLIDKEEDFENNERMLENDYDVFSIEEYIKDKLKKDSRKMESSKNKCFKYLMNSNNISKMIIDFNVTKNQGFVPTHYIDDYQLVGGKRKKENKNQFEIHVENIINDKMQSKIDINQLETEIIQNTNNIWRLDHDQRDILYLTWVKDFQMDKINEIEKLIDEFNKQAKIMEDLRMEEDSFILQDAKIIAMTTTGSSRYHRILKNIEPRIVIVEEAAEVFEAHIVASLSKNCEHLILIGDHIQLRPNPTVYKLAKDYNLDVSLFERLIKNNTKKVMLTCQHRMRPEISQFMKHFYPESIKDHESVKNFENIIGLTQNVFFMNHDNEEKAFTDSQSKVNLFEAKYIAKLCEYLVKQNYEQNTITVLSMYLGQMMQIKSELKSVRLIAVKICTVDNYQGEENDIIILSLVRSNKLDKIGFLKTYNRVCVALSRARKALICIGNLQFISQNSEKWLDIVKTAKETNFYGTGLTLTCGTHQENNIIASEPFHFDQRPDGGCKLPCNFRLECGHACRFKCHTFDKEHKVYKCLKSCDKEIPRCKHICTQICSHENDCNKCSIIVDKVIDECGHQIKFKCDSTPKKSDCKLPCVKVLDCGHLCTKVCGESKCDPCMTKVEVKIPCRHNTEMQINCYEVGNIWKYQNKCPKKCDQMLECGHKCRSQCGVCFGGYLHKKCMSKCERILFCGHVCQSPCSEQCGPCQSKCRNRCIHTACQKNCYEPCSPCLEYCKWRCKHYKCTKKCYQLCDRPPCNEPCRKKLKCGHQCIGLCGDPCPKLCRVCHKDSVSEIFFGSEDELDARFVLLIECGHIVEVKGMDVWIETRFGENKSNDVEKNNTIQLPECPKCKTPIRLNLRYSNYIKKQLNALEVIKSKQIGDKKNNEIIKKELKNEIKEILKSNLHEFNKKVVEKINYNLGNIKYITYNKLVCLTNAFNLFKSLTKIDEEVVKTFNDKSILDHFEFEIYKLIKQIYGTNNIIQIENQVLNDLAKEIERLKALFKYYEAKLQASKGVTDANNLNQVGEKLIRLENLLIIEINPFNEKTKTEVDGLFNDLKSMLKIELSEKEKTMIVKAIGLSKGHWFKCKNDHVYCIGECGGAMQKGICPECKSEIGGSNHRLAGDNQLASEMDGAQFAAWSDTANNFRNFDLNNLI